MNTESEKRTEASTEVQTYNNMMPTFQRVASGNVSKSAATKQFLIRGGRIKVEEFSGY